MSDTPGLYQGDWPSGWQSNAIRVVAWMLTMLMTVCAPWVIAISLDQAQRRNRVRVTMGKMRTLASAIEDYEVRTRRPLCIQKESDIPREIVAALPADAFLDVRGNPIIIVASPRRYVLMSWDTEIVLSDGEFLQEPHITDAMNEASDCHR